MYAGLRWIINKKGFLMAFDQIKTEIAMLLSEMENRPNDKWELHETILEKLNELRALGLPLPQDLVDLEEKLSGEMKQAGKTGGD